MKDNLYIASHPSVSKPPAVGLGGYYNKKILAKQKPVSYFQNICELIDLHILTKI